MLVSIIVIWSVISPTMKRGLWTTTALAWPSLPLRDSSFYSTQALPLKSKSPSCVVARRRRSSRQALPWQGNDFDDDDNERALEYERKISGRKSNSGSNHSQYERQYQSYQQHQQQQQQLTTKKKSTAPVAGAISKSYGQQREPLSLISRGMEEQVLSSARATMDSNTVNRAFSSLFQENDDDGRKRASSISQASQDNPPWTSQQIALASGGATFLLSPLLIPILHSFLPPLLPFPTSLSWEGSALLAALAYIVALGDPVDQSSKGGVVGNVEEVGGAVSRIVGRTVMEGVEKSAPRIKAAARAVVEYDTVVNDDKLQDGIYVPKEEMQLLQKRLFTLESQNESIKRELALRDAIDDISNDYRLEELKEMARREGIRGFSTDGKNALLRKLVTQKRIKLDLKPYLKDD